MKKKELYKLLKLVLKMREPKYPNDYGDWYRGIDRGRKLASDDLEELLIKIYRKS